MYNVNNMNTRKHVKENLKKKRLAYFIYAKILFIIGFSWGGGDKKIDNLPGNVRCAQKLKI